MSLDQVNLSRIDSGIMPGPLHRQLLADRIGRRNALAFSVARSSDPANNRVDPVAGFFRIFETLEQEYRCAFSHHKTIGPGGVGTGATAGEGSDFAELYVS